MIICLEFHEDHWRLDLTPSRARARQFHSPVSAEPRTDSSNYFTFGGEVESCEANCRMNDGNWSSQSLKENLNRYDGFSLTVRVVWVYSVKLCPFSVIFTTFQTMRRCGGGEEST